MFVSRMCPNTDFPFLSRALFTPFVITCYRTTVEFGLHSGVRLVQSDLG
jgi:hypothetical protein